MTTASPKDSKVVSMDFVKFKRAVAKQFDRMSKHELFTVDVDKDKLWDTYLASFPEGTNLVLKDRKNTEHDCVCCRRFIKSLGKVVAIINDKIESVWNIDEAGVDEGYKVVAKALADIVTAARIDNKFYSYEKTAGTDRNFEDLVGQVKTWEHFFLNLPTEVLLTKPAVKKTPLRLLPVGTPRVDSIETKQSEVRASHDTLLRALRSITMDAVETTLELMAQGALYRGEEHEKAVKAFHKIKKQFAEISNERDQDTFVWNRLKGNEWISRIGNSAIGTLLNDLSEGKKELEHCVASYESVVAPTNYKRPTAIVTKAQIEKAKQTIAALGLTSALERRYATIDDVAVNNVLFIDRTPSKAVTSDVFDDIASSTKDKVLTKVDEIPIDKFISDILSKATSVEIMLENRHSGNLVSLVTAADPTAGKLFKWPNNFSWSYNGDVADSIKERVKKAGGNITGELCCRLAWDYTDDLDFHMHEPAGHINYTNRRRLSPNGGMLDVDANGADGIRDNPVENIYYEQINRMREGEYTLKVHNFARRSSGVGFEVEIEIKGETYNIVYDKVVKDREFVEVATLRYTRASGIQIIKSLPTTQSTRKMWGITTQKYHKVKSIMLSPNFWDGHSTGNKHYMFMIDGCVNDETARGFYNEFLKEELNPHRKVIEMVGSKMRTEKTDQQLSGLGFSSTQRNSVLCRVKGAFTRTIKITF